MDRGGGGGGGRWFIGGCISGGSHSTELTALSIKVNFLFVRCGDFAYLALGLFLLVKFLNLGLFIICQSIPVLHLIVTMLHFTREILHLASCAPWPIAVFATSIRCKSIVGKPQSSRACAHHHWQLSFQWQGRDRRCCS